MELAGKKVIVLGAGGFIGTNVTHHLQRQGATVTAYGLDRGNLAGDSDIRFIEARGEGPEALKGAFDGQDFVVYLLGTTTPASSNENIVYDINSNLLVAVAALQEAAVAGVKQFVFISSGGTVYGPTAPVPTPETAPTDPICSYAIVKLAIEKYLSLFELTHGMKSITLRVANPFGPYQRARKGQGAIAAFIEQATRGEVLHIWGDGSVRRDYIYIDDLAEAIAAALTYEGAERLFNIGSGTSRTLNEVVETLRKVEPGIKVQYDPTRAVDVPVSQLSIEKAEAELRWRPKTAWEDGIHRTHRWFLDNVGR